MELNANQIEVGKQYILIEAPFNKAIVTIVKDEWKISQLGRLESKG